MLQATKDQGEDEGKKSEQPTEHVVAWEFRPMPTLKTSFPDAPKAELECPTVKFNDADAVRPHPRGRPIATLSLRMQLQMPLLFFAAPRSVL